MVDDVRDETLGSRNDVWHQYLQVSAIDDGGVIKVLQESVVTSFFINYYFSN